MLGCIIFCGVVSVLITVGFYCSSNKILFLGGFSVVCSILGLLCIALIYIGLINFILGDTPVSHKGVSTSILQEQNTVVFY